MTQVIITATGPGSWTIPAGVTSLQVEAIGGGNSGASGSNNGGGGAGAYAGDTGASAITVTPGATLYYNVGTAGATTAAGLSWVNAATNAAPTSSANGVSADYGRAAAGAIAGAGGLTANSIGATLNAGGNGGNRGGSGSD